jgi:hypothetical protein
MGERRFVLGYARMVKSADTADLKSADHKRSWGFKSPSGHQTSYNQQFLPIGPAKVLSSLHFQWHLV